MLFILSNVVANFGNDILGQEFILVADANQTKLEKN